MAGASCTTVRWLTAPDDRTTTFELIYREIDSLSVQYFERAFYPILIGKLFQVTRLASRPAKKGVIRVLGRPINGPVNQSNESILSLLEPRR